MRMLIVESEMRMQIAIWIGLGDFDGEVLRCKKVSNLVIPSRDANADAELEFGFDADGEFAAAEDEENERG